MTSVLMRSVLNKLATRNNLARRVRSTRRIERRARPGAESMENRDLLSTLPVASAIVQTPLIDPIQAKYQSLGGSHGFLGFPVTPELNTPYGGGRYEKFQGGAIFWSPSTGAHDLYGAVENEFFATANERDAYNNVVQKVIGLPTSDESGLAGFPGALGAKFQGGIIDWSASTGAHVVYGGIGAEYAATAYETDAYGRNVQTLLGLPTSDEMNVPGVSGARMNTFQGGTIYWSPATGAHVVYGGIGAKYSSIGGPVAYGLPVSDEANVPGVSGVRVTRFQNGGAIYWSAATGAHTVYGAIGVEYTATSHESDAYGRNVQGLLARPTSDEMNVLGVSGARMNTFQGGTIYWSASTGAHVVYGAIGAEYAATAHETDAYGRNVQTLLGLPTSDEMNVPGVSGTRMNTFQGGTIYWSASTGAHVVYGAIGAEYAALAHETDYYGRNVQTLLGLPTSDEMNVPGVSGPA